MQKHVKNTVRSKVEAAVVVKLVNKQFDLNIANEFLRAVEVVEFCLLVKGLHAT